FTVELWVQIPIGFAPPGGGGIPLFSFATDQVQDALLFWNVDYNDNKYALELKVHSTSDVKTEDNDAWDLADGEWHSIAVTRSRIEDPPGTCESGSNHQCCWASFYKDGILIFTNPDVFQCKEIKSPGCVVLGQEQDQMCGSFHHKDEFVGNMTE
ncbi:hypothetical protein T484DRAFT_1833639, partial [Baffinella frigidus]